MTAANASGINDGGAAVVLMTAEDARAARHRAARPHRLLGDGRRRPGDHGDRARSLPRAARSKKAGWSSDDLDLVEANEAFAAQACAVNKDLGWNTDIVNVNGGAIAIGHPVGASGARVLEHAALRDEAARRQEGPRDALHRRRHGHRHVRRARLIVFEAGRSAGRRPPSGGREQGGTP